MLLFSPHPGRIRDEFVIDLPRPRDIKNVSTWPAMRPDHKKSTKLRKRTLGDNAVRRFLSAGLFFVVLILLWQWLYAEFVVKRQLWSPMLVPGPRQVWDYLVGAARDGTWSATLVTMRRLLIGYLIGLIGGIPLGLLTARWTLFRDTLGTLALGFQTLPSICWVPLALVWFGQTEVRNALRRCHGDFVVGALSRRRQACEMSRRSFVALR